MEFLDPKKQRAHLIRLFIGYILIGAALILTTIILLYQAYGFGLKNGEVIQSGLVFVSSVPESAEIYVNGQKRSEQTNNRLLLPAGRYTVEIKRAGYAIWKRAITVEGGSVSRFDYPLLVPEKVALTAMKQYANRPDFISQSPNKRWLLLPAGTTYNEFEVYDLSKSDPANSVRRLTLPTTISQFSTHQSWEIVEWAGDNSHLLLKRAALNGATPVSEYILLNREEPQQSINLSTTLGNPTVTIELRGKAYDQYFLYNQPAQTLSTVSLKAPSEQSILLNDVVSYKAYDKDRIIYATNKDAVEAKTIIKLQDGLKSYTIRSVAKAERYLLDIGLYDNDWFITAGSSAEDRTYIYKNPAKEVDANSQAILVPVHILKMSSVATILHAPNFRFTLVQNGSQVALYDAETNRGYAYTLARTLDAPQTSVRWLDGYHLTYITEGKNFFFDYDNTNQRLLTDGDATFGSVFSGDNAKMYGLIKDTAPAGEVTGPQAQSSPRYMLNTTWLRTEADR